MQMYVWTASYKYFFSPINISREGFIREGGLLVKLTF